MIIQKEELVLHNIHNYLMNHHLKTQKITLLLNKDKQIDEVHMIIMYQYWEMIVINRV